MLGRYSLCGLALWMSSAASAAQAPDQLRDPSLDDYAQWNKAAALDSRPDSDFVDNYANDFGDAFFFAPGVTVNALDIHEPRIVIRGFAMESRRERSTVPVFRDGFSLTDVHGDTNAEEIDLLAVRRIDIYRGGADLRFAGDNMGGAVNLISPTGRDARAGFGFRGDGGSSIEGTPGGRVHGDLAGRAGRLDYFASVTGLYETGFRDNNERNSALFNGNIGYEFSSAVSTRIFVDALRSETELAGGLTPIEAAADPSQAAPSISLGPLFPGGPLISFADGAEADNWSRDLIVARAANRTIFSFLDHDFELSGHYARRETETAQIDFIGVVDQTANEWGVSLIIDRGFDLFGANANYRLGGDYSKGLQTSDRFENIDGEAGASLLESDQRSTNLNGFVEMMLEPLRGLVVDMGGKFIMVDRELRVDDGEFEEVRFIGAAARGGVLYKIVENFQVFAAAARTYEPPSFGELTANTPTGLSDIDEQDAFTYEAGLRGTVGDWIGWDITYFNSDVENEIISIDDPETNGLGVTLVNAASTTHRGVEAALELNLFPNSLGRNGSALTLRNVYSYNDFRFNDADPIDNADGNRLGGVPEHVYRGELRYDARGAWFAAVNVQVAAGQYYADHVNEVSVPTHTLVGFSAGWRPRENLEIYASGENLTDQQYAAGVVPVSSQNDLDARIFTPGEGASVYGGVKLSF